MRRPAVVTSISISLILGLLSLGCGQDSNQSQATGSGTGGSPSGGGGGGAGGHGGMSSGSLATSSSSSAASLSASSSASGSASASSSSGIVMPESCTNGIDDDGNGLTDCADPACNAGFTCASDAPAGWNGPVALYDGPSANKPTCPPAHPNTAYKGNSGILPTPAMCSACTCSKPTVFCTPGAVELDADLACATVVGNVGQQPPGMCGQIVPPASTKAAKATPPTPSASACVPSQAMATLPPPQWQTASLTCAGGGIGGGCASKFSCVPRSAAPFETGLCVWRAGDASCPPFYTVKHVYDDNVIDTRGCSACACGAGVGICTATTSVYSTANCTGAHIDIPNNGSCVAVSGGGSMQVAVMMSGSCPSTGGKPTGSVAAGGIKTTVCCEP